MKSENAKVRLMSQEVPDEGTGKHCEKNSQSGYEQELLRLADPQMVSDLTADYYEVHRQAARIYEGGIKRLAIELNKPLDYMARLSDGLNRKGHRRAQVEWRIPLLLDPAASQPLIEMDCRIAGYRVPERKPVATDQEKLRALLDVLGDSDLGQAVLERAARRLGVDRGAFRK